MMPQSRMILQSRHLGTSHSSPNCHQLPHHIFLNLVDGETSSLSKVILILGKATSCRVPNLGCRGAESPGWFDLSPKNSAWDMMHEWACCRVEAANHQLPITVAFWVIWTVSTEEGSSLRQNLMQIRCSFTQSFWMQWPPSYTCSLNRVYWPHWLVQWSCHCSHMRTPVHSQWLPGYIDVMQSALVILTMVELLPDRPHIFV